MSDVRPGEISAAIQRLDPGKHIRLLPGIYTETIVVDRPVTIFADTPGETIIRPPDRACGLRVSADATIIGLAFDGQGFNNTAVEVVGGTPKLEDLWISGAGIGMLVSGVEATPLASRCRFLDCRIGVKVTDSATASFTDCEVADSRLYPLWICRGSMARVHNTRFAGTRWGGVIVQDDNSQAEFQTCEWFDNIKADEKKRRFHAQLMVLDGGIATLSERCRIANGSAIGIMVSGGKIMLTDCAVEENAWTGLQVSQSGEAELLRCQVGTNGEYGVNVSEGGSVLASNVKIVGNGLFGLAISGPASVEISQSRFSGNLYGASLRQGGRGRFQDCDLRGNRNGPFASEDGCPLECIRVQTH